MFYRIIRNRNLKQLPPDGNYTVAGVRDGDSLYIRYGKKLIPIRLNGVDTPELKQPAGRDSKKFLSSLVTHEYVYVRFSGRGKYSRAIADLYMQGVNIAYYLLLSGWAWVYVEYCPPDRISEWLGYQDEARRAKRGLWKVDSPIPPWFYRRLKRLL